MRFRHPSGEVVHLAYCSNVHPAETVDGVVAQLGRFAGPVRARLGVRALGVGLWLAADALAELQADRAEVARLRTALDAGGLEVVTLNGFPYAAFHAPVVKRAVYRPDWTGPERLDYTLGLARVLAALLPDGVDEGTISTLPLGWRIGWGAAESRRARDGLQRLAEGLASLAAETGVAVRVGLEPEPGCVVETVAQAAEALAEVGSPWIGVCLDTCHLAVQFEDPAAALAWLARARIPVVKAQLSSALRVGDPGLADGGLAAYAEPRFLHQTRALVGAAVTGVDDLPDALAGGLSREGEWRVHFHVPIHAETDDTTTVDLRASLALLVGGERPLTRHLEVETYTWTVLPPARRPVDDAGLVEGLARELAWAADRLRELGLEEIA